jgi:hypothetical protein
MSKITSASPVPEYIKDLESYKNGWIRDSCIRKAENERMRKCPEIWSIISSLEMKIASVRKAQTPETMQKNFDSLLVSLMTTVYDKLFDPNSRPSLKTQINRYKHKILLDMADGYANEAKKKPKK